MTDLMVVKADSYEDRILIQGTNSCSNCGEYSLFEFPSAGGYAGYVVQSGDKLFLRQYQANGSHGGIDLVFSDGTSTNWVAKDQDGYTLNNDGTQQAWHYRRADLSSYAGKTLSHIYLVSEDTTLAGAWSIYFTDVAILDANGTVQPLYNRSTSVTLVPSGSSGVTGRTYSVNYAGNESQLPDVTTAYVHNDRFGSSRMISSVNGYPIWQATYLPYGYEYNPQIGVHTYKYAKYRRDSESSLDYAHYRYYSSQWERFMRADSCTTGTIGSPQTLNAYGFVRGNPIAFSDPLGLEDDLIVDYSGGGGGGLSDVFFSAPDPGVPLGGTTNAGYTFSTTVSAPMPTDTINVTVSAPMPPPDLTLYQPISLPTLGGGLPSPPPQKPQPVKPPSQKPCSPGYKNCLNKAASDRRSCRTWVTFGYGIGVGALEVGLGLGGYYSGGLVWAEEVPIHHWAGGLLSATWATGMKLCGASYNEDISKCNKKFPGESGCKP